MHKHQLSPWANIVLYLACLLAVGAVCFALRQPRHSEPTGDLTERFQSEITCYVGDTAYHYRESVLTNLLLMGIDRTEATRQEITAQEGAQADFLLLLTADRETRTLILTHIDRDTITEMTTYGILEIRREVSRPRFACPMPLVPRRKSGALIRWRLSAVCSAGSPSMATLPWTWKTLPR